MEISNNEYMTRTDAAKKLGCTRAAIHNYCKSGLLEEAYIKDSKVKFITKQSFDTFVEKLKPVIEEHKEIEDRLSAYLDMAEDQYISATNELKRKTELVKSKVYFINSYLNGRMASLSDMLLDIVPGMTEREKQIAHEVMCCKSFDNISSELLLSDQRVRQIWSSAFGKIKNMHEEVVRLRDDNKRLYNRIECQKIHIESMKRGKFIDSSSKDSMKLAARTKEIRIDFDQCSVRMYGVLYVQYNVATLFDLLTIPESKLKWARNCGKTTLKEIKNYIAEKSIELNCKLELGMFNNNTNK